MFFGPQKRIFDPFGHIFGPEKGQNSLKIFFNHFKTKHFQKGVTFLCFTVKVLGPKKGFLALLAHVLGEIGQNGPKLFFHDSEAIQFPTRDHVPMFQ